METLRDPIWQFAGAALAFAALLVTVLISLSQRRSKRVACVPRSTPLLSVDAAIRSEVQVLFRNHVVQQVSLVELRFVNFGSLPIMPKDFISEIKVRFGEASVVLTAETLSAKPQDLRDELRLSMNPDAGEITLAPVLLNPSDTFTIKCLVSAYKSLSIASRIAGLRTIEIRDDDFLNRRINWWVWAAMPIVVLGLSWPMSNVLSIPLRTSLRMAGAIIMVAFTMKVVLEAFRLMISGNRNVSGQHEERRRD